jgi:MYXO-CTERM domain-containing protein
MLIPFTLVQSSGVLDFIPKIASPWNLAAFALAVVLYLVLKRRRGEVPFAAWIVIVLLVAIPVGASIYGGLPAKPSIYRLRVTVSESC